MKEAASHLDRIRRTPGGMITTDYVQDETFTFDKHFVQAGFIVKP
jgi:hypothetical protein